MAIQYSVAQRTAAIATLSTTVGSSGVCKLFTGGQPAFCSTADSGTLLATWTFGVAFANAASGGGATIINPSPATATAPSPGGTAGYFRIYTSALVCVMQGNCTVTGGGGDFILTNTNISTGQVLTFASMSVTAGNP